MRRVLRLLPALVALALPALALSARGEAPEAPEALRFKMTTLDGKELDLASLQGKVILVVNVASKCGLTPQYEQLEALHEKYSDQGLVILGVPCNQFGAQEPGTAEQIREFCSATYGVKFPLLGKVDVNGDNAAPLYKYLTALQTEPVGAGKISWNFEKFLIDRKGNVVARYAPRTRPDADDVLARIEQELKAQ